MLLGMGAASDQVSQQPSTKKVDAGTTVAQSATAPSAWGGASKQGKQSLARSMSEIQEEEARVAAKLSKERQIRGVSSGSGWANVAASGAWSSNVKPGVQTAPGPASVVEQSKSTVAAASTVGLSASSTQALRIKQQARVAAQKKAMAKTQVSAAMQQSRNSNNADTNDNFGEDGKMSPTMEAWCRDQLRKLNNGSDDLTLVSFCMSLRDPSEIRQYLSAYLGNSDAVNKFATEFLARKGGKSPETEWESTVPKKGRKKKSVQV